jgi:hypothetical protein
LEEQARTDSSLEPKEQLRVLTSEYEYFTSIAEGSPATAVPMPATSDAGRVAIVAANDEPATKAEKKTIAETITHMQMAPYEGPDAASWEPFRASAHGMTDAQILVRLKTLQATMIGTKPDPRDVIKNRAEEFGLHIALNERKRIAPAFRPYRNAEKPGKTVWIDRWITGDRTLVDLHWYHTMGVLNPSGELAGLLEGEFSFAKAGEVAKYRMKLDAKADAAGIAEVDQLLGTMFRTARIRDRWATIDRRLRELRRTLLELSRIQRYRLDAAAIREIEHAACALFIARGQASVAAKVMVHVDGAPTIPQKMRDHKKRLDRFKCAPGGWGDSQGTDQEAPGGDAGGVPLPKTSSAPGT